MLCASFHLLFTASDGSEGTVACRVVSARAIMMHDGFRTKEVRCARKQNIHYTKQHHTPHFWLPANSSKHFSWLTRSTPIFIVDGHSNTHIFASVDHTYTNMYWVHNTFYFPLCIQFLYINITNMIIGQIQIMLVGTLAVSWQARADHVKWISCPVIAAASLPPPSSLYLLYINRCQ